MYLKRARKVLNVEAAAILGLAKRLDKNFNRTIDLLKKCKGRVVVTGMGKAGLVGQKISATLSSTGTPSLWLHSAEAIHGDLGRVIKDDVVLVLSQSGETEEVKKLLPILKKIGTKTVALTGNNKSTLAKHSDIVLDTGVKKEVCPLGLAPTTSTTTMLAMGDAISVCLQELKGFREEDFALFHPGGSLGKKLLLTVGDIMRKGTDNPVVKKGTKIKDVLFAITKARAGAASVVDKKGKLIGIFTDGDLRRHLEEDADLSKRKVETAMTHKPTAVKKDTLAAEALRVLKDRKIDEVPVVDGKGKIQGMLDVQDLLKAGLV